MLFLFSVLVMVLIGFSYGVLRSAHLRRPEKDPDFDPQHLATHAAAFLVARQVILGSPEDEAKDRAIPWFQSEFSVDEEEAVRLWSAAAAEAMTSQAPEAGLAMFLAPIKSSCTLEEMKDLAAFLDAIALLGDQPTEDQELLVSEFRRRLSLPETLSSADPS